MITGIQLRQFRSYDDASFEFSQGVNIIVGPNASGKTNLLEAILLTARGSSYRVKDEDLIKFNKKWTKVEGQADDDVRIVKIENKDGHTLKFFEISSKPFRQLSLDKTLPAVIFEPEHLRLLSDGPEIRRDFIDDLIEQTTPGYRRLRRQYKRTLAQRNSFLKHGYNVKNNIFAWNIRLSELGGQIAASRITLVKKMDQQITDLYRKLSNSKDNISLVYKSAIPNENYGTNLLHKLESSLELDIERGFTSFGPHRDDLDVFLNKQLIVISGSRGEARTLTLILKVLEAQLIEQARGQKPILLLDDVFSELDGGRRQKLTKFLQPYQTFITTTDADVVIQHFTETTNIIPISLSK